MNNSINFVKKVHLIINETIEDLDRMIDVERVTEHGSIGSPSLIPNTGSVRALLLTFIERYQEAERALQKEMKNENTL
jgi:hypothetical protein